MGGRPGASLGSRRAYWRRRASLSPSHMLAAGRSSVSGWRERCRETTYHSQLDNLLIASIKQQVVVMRWPAWPVPAAEIDASLHPVHLKAAGHLKEMLLSSSSAHSTPHALILSC